MQYKAFSCFALGFFLRLTALVAESPAGAQWQVSASFEGPSSDNGIEPDATIAVGPAHLLVATTAGFAVHSKSRHQLLYQGSYEDFFAPVLSTVWFSEPGQPRVVFEPTRRQFVMLAYGIQPTDAWAYFLIAISQTADPTGAWWFYALPYDFSGATPMTGPIPTGLAIC